MATMKWRPAINYSGYRNDQSPITKEYPSKDEILEDLRILENQFFYLRIYDCSEHAYRTLEVIRENNLNFKVMLGLSLHAEENHIDHPYFYVYPDKLIKKFKDRNTQRIEEIVSLADQYQDIVSSISIGNEIRSIWSNHRLPISRMIEVAEYLKEKTSHPITYCEEYQIWIEELKPLGDVLDFISLHTYPAWQGCHIDAALDAAVKNYNEVKELFPDKDCIITETGWPTSSHGSKIKQEYATTKNQTIYNNQITQWGSENNTLIYLFEAFDEIWKGGDNPAEPEKNWGIYDINRIKKNGGK